MQVQDYDPDLPAVDWAQVQPFVLAVVQEVTAGVPYPPAAIVNAVAHHVDWCVNVASLPLDRGALFRRDIIGYAVDKMPTTSPSTKGRRRSLLLRVAEQLGVELPPAPLTPLAAAQPSQPYRPDEVAELCGWAEYQATEARRVSALALISLGLGAGLPTRDLSAVRAMDVRDDGRVVTVRGTRPRSVPVGPVWASLLQEIRHEADFPEAVLFRPGARWHANIVTVFVDRSSGIAVRPTTQRMRATWIVEQLTVGVPMHKLLYRAGVTSMDALVRYEKYLPSVTG
ncbi:MAG: site-specific integrase [Microbacterium sp.]|nr:site-specific integrase [Microbacterium sp.]